MSTEHKIVYDGCAPHNGEYWYRCEVCGAMDWIASYGTETQLNFYDKPCIAPAAVVEERDLPDDELLRLAAKAIGLKPGYVDNAGWLKVEGERESIPGQVSRWCWNPLVDDGDAFRLAVRLGSRVLMMEIGPGGTKIDLEHPYTQADELQEPGKSFDPRAAARRAIVRAAAAVGASLA